MVVVRENDGFVLPPALVNRMSQNSDCMAGRSELKVLSPRTVESSAPAPSITVAPVIHTPDVRASINVAPSEAPVVNVTNEITERAQEAPVVQVSVEAPSVTVAAPEVTVEVEAIMPEREEIAIVSLPDRRTTTSIVRDSAGNIKESVQTEKDA